MKARKAIKAMETITTKAIAMEKESDMIPGLVIHDLPRDVWKRMRHASSGRAAVAGKKPIHPCIGCFGCWNKTPGQCVVKDGYEKMGALIHHAREVVVISRYTYGGFSGFVKNVFDRSLGYVLPQFEIISGESHHQKRYEEDKAFTFIFYGKNPTEEEKNKARRYVKAVCTNIRGHVKDVQFVQMEEAYAEPYHFPRALYIAIANHGWKKAAKGNGIRPADLYRKL